MVWKEIDYGKMSEKEKQMLVSEVNILREFRHPHIVRYYDRIVDRDNTRIYIVMEYCEGGDLSALIKTCRRERCGNRKEKKKKRKTKKLSRDVFSLSLSQSLSPVRRGVLRTYHYFILLRHQEIP